MPDIDIEAISGPQFEASVRQVARRLHQDAAATGAIVLDGRERDEVIDTGTELIVIEATKERKQAKAEYDLKKSKELVAALRATNRFSEYNFRIILVTADEPTADQNAIVASYRTNCPKEIISFSTLFSRLFDGRHYIRLRGEHSFGSIRNPADETDFDVPPRSYIPTALSEAGTGRSLNAGQLEQMSRSGGRYVIYGDYGSGKSMTLRDIYLKSRERFVRGQQIHCPIYLNLREHIAQVNPDEALFRHAQKIGFSDTDSLISAWRSGYVSVFLDGFDELTPPSFAASIFSLRQARRMSVELVKKFFAETPSGAAIFVAGRENYFDDREEAKIALGYPSSATVFALGGFTDDQIAEYLRAKKKQLPAWLPTRPLLLGYLANSGILSDSDTMMNLSPSAGWDRLVDQICGREVNQIWGAGSDAAELRLFLEGLATRTRKSVGSRGLQNSDLRSVFQTVFGRDADEPANLLASRLPGLGAVPGQVGAREFIDSDFADALGSGDLSRYIAAPFVSATPLDGVQASLGVLGLSLVSQRLGGSAGNLSVALSQASAEASLSVTSADIISLLTERSEAYTGPGITLNSANFDNLVVDAEVKLSSVVFKECVFSRIELGRGGDEIERRNYPRFQDCVIGTLEGVVTSRDLPEGVLDGSTSVERFAAFAATNDAVMESALPPAVKVLLTILRKLFLQRGSGRQYSALKRGLPVAAAKYVEPVTALVRSHGFAEDVTMDRRVVLVPNRSKSSEAFSIVDGPNTSDHELIRNVRAISG